MSKSVDEKIISLSSHCVECSQHFTIQAKPVCEKCFIKTLNGMVKTSRNKRWHIDARKFAYQAVIVMPILAAVQHYMGSSVQLVCGAIYILGNAMNSLTEWLAHKT